MVLLADDERLAELAAGGSGPAFDVLARRHEARLLMVSRSVLRSDADAHDAVQNALLKAFHALQAGQLRGAPRPWLARIAVNEARSPARVRRAVAQLDGEALGVGDDPHELVLAKERLATLVDDVASLPDRLRQPMLMRAGAGLSYEQIASELGVSASASRQAVSEARAALAAKHDAREADCESIRAILTGPDRRRHRSRHVRAHLRSCASCRAWRPERRRLAFLPAPGLVFSAIQWVGRFVTSGGATALRSTAVVAAVATGTIALAGDHHAGQERTPAPATATPEPHAVVTTAPSSTTRTLSPRDAAVQPTRPPAVVAATPLRREEPRADHEQDGAAPRADAAQRTGPAGGSDRAPRPGSSPRGGSSAGGGAAGAGVARASGGGTDANSAGAGSASASDADGSGAGGASVGGSGVGAAGGADASDSGADVGGSGARGGGSRAVASG